MIIEVENLVKHYGEVKAVDSVSFCVEEGEIFGLLGPNGAGKTTIMEILCGLRRFNHGKVMINGFDLTKHSRKIRGMIGFCPQETLLYDLLNVRKTLLSLPRFTRSALESLKKESNLFPRFWALESS